MQIKPPEMRLFKIGLSVLLCLLITLRRGEDPASNTFYACIAAIITLKGNLKDSFSAGVTRTEATLIGASLGVAALWVQGLAGWQLHSLKYVCLLSAMVVLALWFASHVLKLEGVSLSGVVLLSVALNHATDVQPVQFVLHRVTDTVLGIAVALAVNRLLPATWGELLSVGRLYNCAIIKRYRSSSGRKQKEEHR